MTKPTAQACHALTTYFVTKCSEHGPKPVVNRNKARWGFESILMDYTPSQARELIDFYVDRYDKPTVEWFLFNYEKVDEAKQDYEVNKSRQDARRKVTQQRLEEWRNRFE